MSNMEENKMVTTHSWNGHSTDLPSEGHNLILGRVHDGEVRRHMLGQLWRDDLHLQIETVSGAGVEYSAPHIVHTLLQLKVNGPGVEGDFVRLELPRVVKHRHVDPRHVRNLEITAVQRRTYYSISGAVRHYLERIRAENM